MKAFIGHSFNDEGIRFAEKVVKFLESLGLECETGEKPQSKSIAEKVKDRISKCDIFVGLFTKDKKIGCHFFDRRKRYTTSNWVIQESGYAIGLDKKLILLVEKEIYNFPELQGDWELIYYEKPNIEKYYTRLSNMVYDIISQIEDIEPAPKTSLTMPKKESEDSSVSEEKYKKEDEIFLKLFKALLKEKDYEKGQKIFYDEYRETLENDEEKLKWESRVLVKSHEIGDTSAIDKLRKLCEDNEKNPDILSTYGNAIKKFGGYEEAIKILSKAANLYYSERKDMVSAAKCFGIAARCLLEKDRNIDAFEFLYKIFNNNELADIREKIIIEICDMAKENEFYEILTIYGELALENDPSNLDLRFNVGYGYSQLENNEMTFYHYNIIVNSEENYLAYNNIGVAYARLKMSGKSNLFYKRAVEGDNSLAMGNLAFNYIGAGFYDEAHETISKSDELKKRNLEINKHVVSAKQDLIEKMEKEDNLEKNILKKAIVEREFRVNYSLANVEKDKAQNSIFEGYWKSQYGRLEIDKVKENGEFYIFVEKRKKLIPTMDIYTTEYVEVKGLIIGFSAKYEIEIGTLDSNRDKTKSETKKGIFYIESDKKIINTMEIDSKGNRIYKKWTKIL